MYIEQLYTNCLAHAAYYIESNGEAAIIDPLRETGPYVGMAAARKAEIKYIFETHFHADFVSGHVDLAKETGAEIIFGPNATPGYNTTVAEDGQTFKLGEVTFKVLHTPGHTMESTTYLLYDEDGKEHAIFTGDTLFIGDVGRPDLAVKTDLSMEDLARHLYDSLHNKIMPLPDEVIVYPGHGAGSACGKNLSDERWQTLGHQKKNNYALQPMDKDTFVKEVTTGLATPPAYFPENAKMNKAGYSSFEEVMERNQKPLSVKEFEQEIADGALLLDTRDTDKFEAGHVPGALNIALSGQYAPWVGALIPFGQRLVLVTEPDNEEEAIRRLARVGYENVAGYLQGGVETWKQEKGELATVGSIEPKQVKEKLAQDDTLVLDVRKESEYDRERLNNAVNLPLSQLEQKAEDLDKEKTYMVHCAGGYRSMIASSLLKKHGFRNVLNIHGGFDEMKKQDGLDLQEGACPTKAREERLAAAMAK